MGKWRLDPGQIEVVDEAIAKVLRTKQPWERVAMIGQANETMRALIEGHLRTWHPNWSDEQIKREVGRRLLREAT
jgi:ABC-type transport system involved in cytochrome bd biosynthesis fused ATPase/permease subunit